MRAQRLRVLLLALAIAGVLSYFASARRDWLESILARATVETQAPAHLHGESRSVPAPFPGYGVPGLRSPFGSNAAAGVAGTVATLALLWLILRVLGRKSHRQNR